LSGRLTSVRGVSASVPASLGQSETARVRGVSRQAVQKRVRRGLVTTDAAGRLDPAAAAAEIEATLDPTRGGKGGGPTWRASGPSSVADEGPGHVSFNEAKRREAVAKAGMAQIEHARLAGQVVDVQAVREAGGDLAEVVAQGLERLAPGLAKLARDAATPSAADRAVRAALGGFRREVAEAVRRRCAELAADA
jgi:hypothetical protein